MDTFSTGYARSLFVGMEASEDSLRMMTADSYRLDETTAIEALLRRAQFGKAETTNFSVGRAGWSLKRASVATT